MNNFYEIKEKKMRESIDCEDFNAINCVPINYQNMANFISNSKLEVIFQKDYNYEKIMNIFSTNQTNETIKLIIDSILKQDVDLGKDKDTTKVTENKIVIEAAGTVVDNTNSSEIKNTISINLVNYKLMLTSLDIIKIIYDSLKILTLFDSSLEENIIQNLTNFLNIYISLNKQIVVDGEAKFKLTQREISIACSNVNIIKYLLY